MSITKLLSADGFLSINKHLIKSLGSLECAAYLSTLCSKHDYWASRNLLKNGFFYATQDQIESELCIHPKVQRKHCKRLEQMGVLETKLEGLPKKKFYRINELRLMQVIENTVLVQNGLTEQSKMAYKEDKNNKIKEEKEHCTSLEKKVTRVFSDELPQASFPLTRNAVDTIKGLKQNGADNLYDGPLPYDLWEDCESTMTALDYQPEDVEEVITKLYRYRYTMSAYRHKDSINLPYMLHAYDERSLEGMRVKHIVE